MKVLMLNPPWYDSKRLGVRAGSRWSFTIKKSKKNQKIPSYVPFPFYLAYTTSLLKKEGFEAEIIDAIAEGITKRDFVERVVSEKPDLFILETSTASFEEDIIWYEKIKDVTGAKGILVGPHVTVFGKQIMEDKNFVDFVVSGEYEFVVLKLVQALSKRKSFKNIKGLVYRQREKIISNGHSEQFDINLLPWPERESLPMKNYSDTFGSLKCPSVQIVASRGCPFNCIFCLWPKIMYGKRNYRTRDVMDVVNEIEYLVKRYNFRSFYFDDDTFNIGKERIVNICREISKRPSLKNVEWGAMCRADTLDREMLYEMRKSGLVAIKFGVETADKRVMESIGKALDLEKVDNAIKHCKDLGIKVHLTFTLGLPGETKESLRKTINYPIEKKVDSVQFSIVTPFPGTDYFEMLKSKNRINCADWSEFDGSRAVVFEHENLGRNELVKALKVANKKWIRYLIAKNLFNPEYYKKILMNPWGSFNFIRGGV